MNSASDRKQFRFAISLSVLNHLGRNLYRNFITVLGEAISNAWDADASNVWIDIDRQNATFAVRDDGTGMDTDDFQNKFLKIGYSKRAGGNTKTRSGRPYIGAKGIGKLALLSCARKVSVFSKARDGDYIGGVIDNSGLDAAITDELLPEEYPLEEPDFDLIGGWEDELEHGTIVVFEDTKDQLSNSLQHLRKLLAMSFHFSLLDENFSIYVNNEKVTIDDLADLSASTEFVWLINRYSDDYLDACEPLESDPIELTTNRDVKGFLATVEKPRHLKIAGTDERATVDLFVNGRLREKHILRHIPTQRIPESYIYGQIHFDAMDVGTSDPFTSSREGVIEDNEDFRSLLEYLKYDVLPAILDKWDELRLSRGKPGDEENVRRSKKSRKAQELYSAAREEYEPGDDAEERGQVRGWLTDLRDDAEFNLQAYVDCFLSENLIRKYIARHNISLTSKAPSEIKKWKDLETNGKCKANISFDIRRGTDDLTYLGMDFLVLSAEEAEGPDAKTKSPSLWPDALSYKPVRNAVAHTGLLTDVAKSHLSVTYENIKARVNSLVARRPPK